MTTIAYRDGILASDGRMTSGGIIVSEETEKVFRCDGRIMGRKVVAFGISGHSAAVHYVNMKEGVDTGTRFPVGIYFNLIAICEDGAVIELSKVEEDTYCHINEVKASYHAAGSGYQLALGAMSTGCSAEGAVMAAVKHDSGTGGKIKVIEVFK